MEPALKQRLIGAAVLVALAVIFLPMLLDSPAPPATRADAVPLDIPPSPDQPLQTREIPLTLPSPVPNAADSAAPAASSTATQAEDSNRVATVDVPSQKPADVRPELDSVPTAPATTAPAVPADAPAETMPTATAPSPAPAAAALATSAPSSGYAVNLGSYANVANAEALRERLIAVGLPVYAESIDVEGKPVRRLRAGPFASRAAAEDALLSVRQKEPGISPSVVSLEGSGVAVAVAPSKVRGFAVQISAMKLEADANALRDKLRGGGFAAFVERLSTDHGVLFRVRVGPHADKASADKARDVLKQKFPAEAQQSMVVAHP